MAESWLGCRSTDSSWTCCSVRPSRISTGRRACASPGDVRRSSLPDTTYRLIVSTAKYKGWHATFIGSVEPILPEIPFAFGDQSAPTRSATQRDLLVVEPLHLIGDDADGVELDRRAQVRAAVRG